MNRKRFWTHVITPAVILALLSSTALTGCKKEAVKSDSDELSYWCTINNGVAASYANLGDTPMAQNLEKLTGIKVKYIHPAQGQETEQFNLLLNSKQMPDMIEYNFYTFAGGPEKAIGDGYILPLNDLIENHSPNLKKFLAENPEIKKMITTDNQNYYVYPFIRGDDSLKVYTGPIVRKDWLDDLGLSIPETIDEWHTVLTAFKNEKGAKAPFATTSGNDGFIKILNRGDFIGAFGITGGFYLDKGKVTYGYARSEYKDFLDTYSQWFKEGLIDPDYATTTSRELDNFVLTGRTGSSVQMTGGGIGKWTIEGRTSEPRFEMVAAPHPVMNKGDKPEFGQKDWSYMPQGTPAITTSCQNPELAAKFLDFGYSEEGMLAYNFGTEGVSYNMVDGYPTYTDLILKDADGLSVSQAMAKYIRASYSGPFIQMKEYGEQYFELPQQKDSLVVWANSNMDDHLMPYITFLAEESDEMAKIQQNVEKHAMEYSLNVIMGKESTATFDAYISQLNSYGLERLLEIYNVALLRYNQR